jgi:hypothetical protein
MKRIRQKLAHMVALLMFLVWQVPRAAAPVAPSVSPDAWKQMAKRLATGPAVANFAPSLETREVADFLITPALVIQEAISEQVVPTYPSE